MNIKLILPGAIMAAAICAVCTVIADPEPAAYADVEVAPAHVETYPTTVYEGHTVYYVGDRWVYRDGPRWVYYRTEPPQLARHRRYVQQAPRNEPPHREHDHRSRMRGAFLLFASCLGAAMARRRRTRQPAPRRRAGWVKRAIPMVRDRHSHRWVLGIVTAPSCSRTLARSCIPGLAMADTRADVLRFLAGHRAAERRQRELTQEQGPRPDQAVSECLDAFAMMEGLGTWPGPRDAVQERDIRRVRALWAKVKRGYSRGSKA